MDDLTAGEALPHVSAAHIDLPPRRSARSVARLSIVPVEIERAEAVDVLFPKFWRLLCVASLSSILSRLH